MRLLIVKNAGRDVWEVLEELEPRGRLAWVSAHRSREDAELFKKALEARAVACKPS